MTKNNANVIVGKSTSSASSAQVYKVTRSPATAGFPERNLATE
jgi:hypothetical protein